MTIRVTITTPNDKQARVTRGADVDIVDPGQTREFCVHDSNPSITIIEQPVPGASANRSGGGGHGDPDVKN
jgi:hypothetical protein